MKTEHPAIVLARCLARPATDLGERLFLRVLAMQLDCGRPLSEAEYARLLEIDGREKNHA